MTTAQPNPSPPPRRAQQLGARGEDFAAEWYSARGARVIARNVSNRFGEIDLILREDDGTTVFAEVKTRSTAAFGAAEAVTARKLARMRRAAAFWLAGRPWTPVRFDVLALVGRDGGRGFQVDYYEGVEHGSR